MDRNSFIDLLKENTGLIMLKFGAEWCNPCKQIEDYVEKKFSEMPTDVTCIKIDVDEHLDLYAFLKSKKMVQGIPTILCYEKGNETYIPIDIVSGTDEKELDNFFKRCLIILSEL
jgi:thiol:disulfide interchange protein|tara:strand:+ start:724 stop:1068 length:345 start_codon:yes stop_codon:yes gene_type:complete